MKKKLQMGEPTSFEQAMRIIVNADKDKVDRKMGKTPKDDEKLEPHEGSRKKKPTQ